MEISFSADVLIASDDFRISSAVGTTYTLSGFAYDAAARTASWVVTSPPSTSLNDELTLLLDGSAATGVTSPAGIAIGDWTRAVSVLTGDVDGNGLVNTADGRGIRRRYGAVKPANWFTDIDGNGVINGTDYNLALSNIGQRLV